MNRITATFTAGAAVATFFAAPSGVVAAPRQSLQIFTVSTPYLAWQVVRNQLERWKKLPADWDGSDGVAPSQSVIAAASAFVDRVQSAGVTAPVPYVAGDGEVGFRWAKDNHFASVAFLEDGNIVAYVRDGVHDILEIDEPASQFADTAVIASRLIAFT